MRSPNHHRLHFCKSSDEHLQNVLCFPPNKHVWKSNRKLCDKIGNENNPLPQDVTLKYSDLPFSLILCGFLCVCVCVCVCWEYSTKSYHTLKSKQNPTNRKRYLKIILTKWVMTDGESKAGHSRGCLHRPWKPGLFLMQSNNTSLIFFFAFTRKQHGGNGIMILVANAEFRLFGQ